ncbi:DUF1998 domain-containing protein [Nannocystis sp. SCPEA4]|uniref:DUF1998 domain-containing protein n=1 Tax=Nannocystis sp. SCPEA4 TaxID=2996787 RepID=UPI00226E639E|nr:DUF1998 domain-containing protein [Nannocystis sp. SCPEA4]
MSKPRKAPISGQIRRSQMITTFGPGAMVDLPLHAVLIGGLEHWTEHGRKPVHEKRLEASIVKQLELPPETRVPMYTPPVDDEDPASPRAGVTSFVFPAWFVAQLEGQIFHDLAGKPYRTRPLVHWRGLDGGSYYLHDGKKVPVVPVRFVQACRNGHISDIDWHRFVHAGEPPAARARLWIDEGGTGGDLGDIYIRCEATGARRPLGEAKLPDSRVLGRCRGDRPWLGRNASEPCRAEDGDEPEWSRLLVRSASNAYFAQVLRVISLPEADEAVRKAVDTLWDDELAYVDDLDDLIKLRRKNKPKVTRQLGALKDADIWNEIERRRRGFEQDKKIKVAEIETLLACPPEAAHDEEPDDDFHARTRTLPELTPILAGRLERVVLVHKLREVVAQIGFTRFEAVMPDIDGELNLGVRRAALSRDQSWLPAVENRGEGVFLGFDDDAIAAWLRRERVKDRGRQLAHGFDAWKDARRLDKLVFPGLPYIMLHSLAHLLVQAVALECGYAATAISERIYAGAAGHGILLYTGTPGSEGTLGGLVAVGRRIEHYLRLALELGRLCSNDPICAQHEPHDRHEERFLHGAACHGCLLIGEPSCERRNELLDRALVVSTVDALGAEFFVDP